MATKQTIVQECTRGDGSIAPSLMGVFRSTVPALECLTHHGVTATPSRSWQGCETYHIMIPAAKMDALDGAGLLLVHCWRPPGAGCPAFRMCFEPPYPDEKRDRAIRHCGRGRPIG